MYEYLYDYAEPKYGKSAKLPDLMKDVGRTFDALNLRERTLPIWKNKYVIGLMKDELGGKIMEVFSHWYQRCIATWQVMAMFIGKQFEDYENCLENDKIILKSQMT